MQHLARRVTHAASAAALAAVPNMASAQSAVPQPPRFFGSPGQFADYEITRDSSIVHGGRVSIRIRGNEDPIGFGNVSAIVPAQSYVRHQIRFSVFLRAEKLGGQGGQLWARADDANHRSVAFINSVQTTQFSGTADWKQLSISLDIPPTAAQIFFGVISAGPGTLWCDDARLEADGGAAPLDFDFEALAQFTTPPTRAPVPVVREAPRAFSSRGLANVSAFTTALGYVRFFHPGPEAVPVNWDVFAVRGIRAIESATTPDGLASALSALFAPIAPSVRFARTGTQMPAVAKPANATGVVFWQHMGIGSPSGGAAANSTSAYRSQRVIVPLADVGQPLRITGLPNVAIISMPRVPDPSRPVSVTLDGGVTMSVPVALYTADTTVPPTLRTSRPMPNATERLTPNDRATRLAAVALAWSLFEHFYPYFDVVHTDWPAARETALRAAATDSSADQFDATLDRLIAALHDGHGRVSRAGKSLATTDVQLTSAEGRVIVTAVGDSSAAKGVQRGDELVEIDGRDVATAIADKSSRISGATPQWVRNRAVTELLVGEARSVVQARFRGADGSMRNVGLTRGGAVPAPATQIDKISEVSSGVMYVDLGRITDADFSAALPQLERARAIIFDMRGYPRQVSTPAIFRHLTDSTIHSAHFEIPIITMPGFRDVGYVDGAWDLTPVAPRLTARIVFLSGGGAISYAESTLGIVEAYRLGDIVGEASAGTNGNINPFMLPGGYNVSWTGMLVQKRDGTPHHGVGIQPTVAVSPTVAGLRAGRDEVLERAISLVTRPLTP